MLPSTNVANMPGVLLADHAEIERFVSAIFRYADVGSLISLRAFDQVDRGGKAVLVQAVAIGGDVVGAAEGAAQRAANWTPPCVFCPPLATFSNLYHARTIDLVNGVVLSVELDQCDTFAAKKRLEHLLGPATVVVTSGGEWTDPATGQVFPKLHLHWRLSEPTRTPDEHGQLREARTLAALLVGGDPTAASVVHPLRWPGSWHLKGSPRLARISGGNEDAEVHLQETLEALQDAVERAGMATLQGNGPPVSAEPTADLMRLADAVAHIQNPDLPWDGWIRIGMALWRASGGSDAGLSIWEAWSATSSKYEPGACDERWAHFASSPPSKLGAGTLFFLARAEGWVPKVEAPEPPDMPNDDGYLRSLAADAEAHIAAGAWAPEADAPHIAAAETKATPALNISDDPWDEAMLPTRPWVAKGYLMRRSVSVLAGVGSSGKSGLAICWSIALAFGLLWSRFKPVGECIVSLYNGEDDDDEQRLRISAALKQFGRTPTDLRGRLYRLGPSNVGTLVERDPATKTLRFTAAMDALIDHLEDVRPDVLFLDPFIAIHNADENDSGAVRAIMATFRPLAVRFNMAVLLAHHLRKGSAALPGDADTIRGSSDIVGASRVVLTLTIMSEDDAKTLDISTDQRRHFFRVDGAKQNYAPIGEAEWFQRFEHALDNGEAVAAVEPCSPPNVKPSADLVAAALQRIALGSPTGEPWSPRLSDDKRSFQALAFSLSVEGKAGTAALMATLKNQNGVTIGTFSRGKGKSEKETRQGLRTATGEPHDAPWVDD